MRIFYDGGSDLLYFRFDEGKQDLINRRISDDVVLDVGAGNRIVGIEILGASERLDLASLLPITYETSGRA